MTVAGLGSQRGWKEMEGSGASRPAADGSDESAIRGHRLQGRHVVGVGAARTVGQQDGDPVMYQRRRAGTKACSRRSTACHELRRRRWPLGARGQMGGQRKRGSPCLLFLLFTTITTT
ncbi:hypothetical protein COCMIDRAFT_86649 [Bipolaris oryzae ATCC 44560]|uniref:Uncharacterized protein n=1 Tax=Bipolaris oryzae ATCC 44560 TaxID=930090 RepID=W6ZFN1_COCMI|nr:uncharacterized protein COCMIDRAFT_86649 [Bipolaris oryzae ATCC 44560]EUC48683.1 hypothetical protein COCMIDRAFT_86649 [Bipolaris oryzae ATCC 44560]